MVDSQSYDKKPSDTTSTSTIAPPQATPLAASTDNADPALLKQEVEAAEAGQEEKEEMQAVDVLRSNPV